MKRVGPKFHGIKKKKLKKCGIKSYAVYSTTRANRHSCGEKKTNLGLEVGKEKIISDLVKSEQEG